MNTRHWLYLTDDGRILLVRDPGDGHDLEARAVRSDYEVPPDLRDDWHRLDAERRGAREFGAACVAEAAGTWERSRGRFGR